MRRMGNNKKPFFRIVATDERSPQSGRYLENLGWYDPKVKGNNCEIKLDRVEFWKSKGAVITHAVQSLVRKLQRASKAAAA
jgi:small subunit ribosomal protein S16